MKDQKGEARGTTYNPGDIKQFLQDRKRSIFKCLQK